MDRVRTSPRWRSLRATTADPDPRATPVGASLLRSAGVGAASGALWGVAARGWMRLVSTSPEFSWTGTLLIVGLAATLGAGVAVSSAARSRTGWRRVARLAVVPGMVMFAGQGIPFLPAFVVGGLLLRRRHVVARMLTVLAVAGPAVLVWWSERLDEYTMLSAPTRVQVSLLLGMPVLAMVLAFAGDRVWGRRAAVERQSASPERARSSLRSDSSLDAPAGPA